MMESYSQCGQDLFVFNILKKEKGTFLDLGCNLPKKINNTYLLELNEWYGTSLDITDYSENWKERNTKFINVDCFNVDYKTFLPNHYKDKVIDYLSLDMEKVGERYKLLAKLLETDYTFKVITIEHDSHLGNDYIVNERTPQRELLTEKGYILLCSNVSQKQHPNLFYEDWWVNPNFFNEEELKPLYSNEESCDKILKKLNVEYTINEISQKW